MGPRRVVIVGGVAGGMSTATRLRRLDEDTAEIVVLERSGHVSYANCGLPYFVGGVIEDEEDLLLQTPERLFDRFRLDVPGGSLGDGALHPRRHHDGVALRRARAEPGCGPGAAADPRVRPRADVRGTVEDAERLVGDVSAEPRDVVAIGVGFVGIETAENLADAGTR